MRHAISIRTYITVLIVATILPILIFAGLLVHRAATNEQELMTRAMRDTTRAAAIDLNRQIGGMMSLALSIADARTLQADEMAAFHVRWSHVVEREGQTAVLYDTAGQQVVNTSVPFGTVLPAEPEMISRVLATGAVEISGLTREKSTGMQVISITVPVRRDGKLIFILSLRIMNAIASVMAQQIFLPEQVAELIDRGGAIIHRTSDLNKYVGVQITPDFLQEIDGRDDGWFVTKSLDDVPVYVAFNRVKLTGWVLAVAMPTRVLFAPATQSLLRLFALAGGTLLLVSLLAWAIGRRIANAVAGLTQFAVSLGTGAPDEPIKLTHIREVNAVAESMHAASDTLRQQVEHRERAEQQLVQSQKMEAVGQLTGGMAHDFNNLLAIIVGSLELLRERSASDPVNLEFAEEAMNAASRGAELTRQMLVFARRQPLVPVRCDLNEVITVFVRLLSRTLGEDIVIDLQLAPDLWPVRVDRVQFEATITNLATNARHAMPRGGRLTIATRNTHLDEDYAETHMEVAAGDYVSIEVRDTGTGMAPHVMDRIFEPFFTTKEPGQGTGLGLSMVFGFLKQSGGHITAYSELGSGTTFQLYLPPALGPESLDAPTVSNAPAPGASRGEIILAVEDNSVLRRILCRQLTDAGYRVIEADNARSALNRIESNEPIDLLLTDIVMPGGMNGHELARLAALLRPGLKILLTSGFSDSSNGGASQTASTRFLRKPYSKDDLLRLVHEALNSGEPATNDAASS